VSINKIHTNYNLFHALKLFVLLYNNKSFNEKKVLFITLLIHELIDSLLNCKVRFFVGNVGYILIMLHLIKGGKKFRHT